MLPLLVCEFVPWSPPLYSPLREEREKIIRTPYAPSWYRCVPELVQSWPKLVQELYNLSRVTRGDLRGRRSTLINPAASNCRKARDFVLREIPKAARASLGTSNVRLFFCQAR